MIRKAILSDISSVDQIYHEIHTEEESGRVRIGWIRGIYPTRKTALDALSRDNLFVLEERGQIIGAAIINHIQPQTYAEGNWQFPAPENEVMVLHTLVISPAALRKGYGRSFVLFYEAYAAEQGCCFLRLDTNEKNANARAMYRKLGYQEIGVVPCEFNGIPGVNLVLLEKRLI